MDNNYDYNPVTDKFYKNNSKPLSADGIDAINNVQRKQQEHAESIRRMQDADTLGFALDRDAERLNKEMDRKLE